MNLNVSNIQHFSVGDGKGIRTTVFFKGCNLKCPWCHNPENLSFAPVTLNYKDIAKTEILGKNVTVEEILPELLEDIDFYLQSGGGVTLSGGEVMFQADGAALLAKALKERQINTLIDTAGCVAYSDFLKLNDFADGYLFDFKTADAEKYKEIGGNLNLVIENLKNLMAHNQKVQIRIPLIPNFNTDKNSIIKICKTLKEIGIKEVELLPFHRLGSAKYEALGLCYAYKNVSPLTNTQLEEIKKEYSQHLKVIIER